VSKARVKTVLRAKDQLVQKFKQAQRSDQVLVLFGLVLVLSIIFLGVFASVISPYSPTEMGDDRLSPPSTTHLMGTDYLGRDVFSRILYGTRVSLVVAVLAISLSLAIGAGLGSLSGYFGGHVDRVIGVFMDALYSFPVIILALVMAFALGTGVEKTAIAVGIALVPSNYRLTRSLVLSVKERGFIEGVKAIGAGNFYVITRHILPNCLSSLAVLTSFNIAEGIISVAGLGFIGLGIQQPTPEWGGDLKIGRDVLAVGAWWVSVFPGLMIFLMVVGINSLAEGINAMFKIGVERR